MTANDQPTQTPKIPAPRVDLYRMIHKALRKQMFDVIYGLGRVDAQADSQVNAAIADVLALMGACESHLNKEAAYVHPAMEARAPHSTQQISNEHDAHVEAIELIREQALAVRTANGSERELALHRLYLTLSVFVGENLIHMHQEEQEHNAVLWACYSDAELLEIEQHIIASVEPAEMTAVMRLAVPA